VVDAALVTGGGRRIGRAIAEGLAADGWAVAVHFHGARAEAEEAVATIAAAGGRAAAVAADLGNESEVAALVARAEEALGVPATCLVNNAARFERDGAATATKESWDRHMDINLRAPFVLTQNLAAQLPAGADGHVINLLDQRVWNLTGEFTSYTVSKSALWTLTRTLALAFAPRIRVNSVAPGPVLPSERQKQAHFDAQVAATPLAHPVAVADIVSAVRFFLATPSVTGQLIATDSGQHLVPGGRAATE
jgi:NAD(P)-dependent dehydrogenase (short-subunit alcohol dehydrogenase family)